MYDTLVQIAICVVAIYANFFINFASNKVEAWQNLKVFFLNVVAWVAFFYMIHSVYSAVFSEQPLTRLAVFEIAFSISVLAFMSIGFLFQYGVRKLVKEFNDLYSMQEKTLGIVDNIKDTSSKKGA